MTNRRQFIQTGLAVSASSFALPRALAAEAGQDKATSLPVELYVYDDRYAEAVEAANAATASNIRTASTHSVMTGFWYDELDLAWKQSPMTLAGMTTEHGLFVLETLALDRGMHVLNRAANEKNQLVSWVIGPRKQLNSDY